MLVRFADDVLVMCKSREQAEVALLRLRDLLAELGLRPKEAKTRIVALQVGGEGFDFLGVHHRLVQIPRRPRPVTFLARWPADNAMRHARVRPGPPYRHMMPLERSAYRSAWSFESMRSRFAWRATRANCTGQVTANLARMRRM